MAVGRPGRPSQTNDTEWARKTYKFKKSTLRKLKIMQATKHEHVDLSVLIDRALRAYLK